MPKYLPFLRLHYLSTALLSGIICHTHAAAHVVPTTLPLAVAHDPATGRQLLYQIAGDEAVLGDIILGRHDDIGRAGVPPPLSMAPAVQQPRHKRASRQPRSARWPDNTVHYSLRHANATVRAAFRAATAEIEAVSALRFVERSEQMADITAYVDVHSDASACRSYVGRTGGRQQLTLADWCESKGKILHEIMHAIGFAHEHQRSDRDAHIVIDSHVQLPELAIKTAIETHTPYDMHSITHYRLHIMRPLDPEQRLDPVLERLSPGDIAAINALYPPLPPSSPPRIDIETLDIQRDGVGHIAIHGGSLPLKGRGISVHWPPGGDLMILTRGGNARRLIVRPRPGTTGDSVLTITLHYENGNRQKRSLPVRVAAPAPDAGGRQLVARASGQCLQAMNDARGSVRMQTCREVSTQRWMHTSGGEIVSTAFPDRCLELTAPSATLLRACRQHPNQRWRAEGPRLLGTVDGMRPLSQDAEGEVFAATTYEPVLGQQWDWN